jgi:hypothetical protein
MVPLTEPRFEGVTLGIWNQSRIVMRNKFYVWSYTADPEIIGKGYPQVMEAIGDQSTIRSIHSSINSFPEVENHPILVLRKGAKLTDFISTSYQNLNGFYVSTRVKDIMQSMFCSQIRFYDCTVRDGDRLVPYHWMHITALTREGGSILQYMNFANSRFFIGDAIQREIRSADIYSLQDYEKQKKIIMQQSDNKELLWLRAPCFTGEIEKYDLFGISPLSLRCYISDRLRTRFETEGITGVMIRNAKMSFS